MKYDEWEEAATNPSMLVSQHRNDLAQEQGEPESSPLEDILKQLALVEGSFQFMGEGHPLFNETQAKLAHLRFMAEALRREHEPNS